MNRYWENDEAFKKRSKKCSTNGKLGPDKTHGHGSISGVDLRKKMAKEKGGVETMQLEWIERAKTSKKTKQLPDHWKPIVDEIREKTIAKHGTDRSNHPLLPTPETYPAPNQKNRIPGHSGVNPERFGIRTKKRYSLAGGNVVLEREKTDEEIEAEKLNEVRNQCIFQIIGPLPCFRDIFRQNFINAFGREPEERDYPRFDSSQWTNPFPGQQYPPAGSQAPPPPPENPPPPPAPMANDDPSQYLNDDPAMEDEISRHLGDM